MPEHIALTVLCQQKTQRKIRIDLFCRPHQIKKSRYFLFGVQHDFNFLQKIREK